MRKSALAQLLLLGALAISASHCNSENKKLSSGEAAVTKNGGPESPEIDFIIVPGQRVGQITATSTEADINALYEEKQIEIRSVYLGEGDSQLGIAVFPNTPNELEIVWDIAAATGNPEFIRISQEHADWHTVQGIRVGTTLEELEKINGKPFDLYGFGWDYGGLVNDWNGGNLNHHLIIALEPDDWGKVAEEVSGDRHLSSDDPKVRALGVHVASMVVTFQE